MTTQVTVQYDGDRLLERSRQQQQAARQVKASSDRIKAAASIDKAQQQRAGTLPQQQAQRYGTLEQRLRVRDEPAAFRAGFYDMLLPPTDAAFNAQVRNGRGFSFQKIFDASLSSYGTSDTAAFIADGRYTTNANAIEFIRPSPATGTAYSLGVQGGPGNLALSATDNFTIEAWAVVGYGLSAADTSLQRRLTNEAIALTDYGFSGAESLRPHLLTLALDHQFGDVRFTAGVGGFLYGTNVSLSQPWGSWNHIAAVRTDGDILFYANGVLQFRLSTSSPVQMPSATLSSTNLGFRVGATQRASNVPTNAPCRVSRVRFTKRALYSSNFTPL